MKQLGFMVLATLAGTVGVFAVGPFWGVMVYYLFALLRPQFLWEWALPADIQWSRYVALATIAATVLRRPAAGATRRSTGTCWLVYLYFAWVVLTSFTARHPEVSWPYFNEFIKIFAMYIVSAAIIGSFDQLWSLLIMAALILGYIAIDVNHLYLATGYSTLHRRGYAGLDNNGAALMLAMGVPLCVAAWDAVRTRWRWAFLALVPVLIHAVMTTYSRGAMLALVVATPLIVLRSRRKIQLSLLIVGLAVLVVPVLAGPEIRARFSTISEHDQDESARSRKDSWAAALRIARDNPIFGVGVRNSNLYSRQYGADMEGRTIHNQYLQTAADSGFVGLGLYLAALGSAWLGTRRARRFAAGRDDLEARRAHAVAGGAECSLAVFCIGGVFLSLETFELPFLMMLLGTQAGALTAGRSGIAPVAAGRQR